MQKIKTFLWYDNQAEEAATFYVSVFKNSKITSSNPMITEFELDGVQLVALNGGPAFNFTEAISLYIDCADQAEVDELWEKLGQGSDDQGQCGWIKDKYGVSWQVVPRQLGTLMGDPNPAKAAAVGAALRGMNKIDIQGLRDAYDNA